MSPSNNFIGKVLLVFGLFILFAGLSAVFVIAARFFLLIFAGVLLGIVLRTFGEWLSKYIRLNPNLSTGLGILIIFVSLTAIIYLCLPILIEQYRQLEAAVPQTYERLKEYKWFNKSMANLQKENPLPGIATLIDRSTVFLTSFMEVAAALMVIVVIGVFVALEPEAYLKEILRIVPPPHRQRTLEVIQRINVALHWWVIGGLADMAIVGVLTMIGLTILGVPMALLLGLIAGVLIFIPTFGPLISVVPAALLASAQSSQQVINVIILYVVIQIVESSLIAPVIMRKSVRLPPAFILIGQVLFGVLFGFLGLALAIPILAVVSLLVRMLYVEDILGQAPLKSDKSPKKAVSTT